LDYVFFILVEITFICPLNSVEWNTVYWVGLNNVLARFVLGR
jgi:hypothetical protein